MSYENKHVLRDGRITLYTRNDRSTFHVRLKIEGHKGYIVKSTKRRTLAEAVRVAEDHYDDLRYKVRQGLEIKPHTFNSMWRRWKEANQNLISFYRMRYLTGTAERYFLPYFEDRAIEDISHSVIEAYWTWRINYWSSHDGQAKIENAQKSRTTRKRPYKQKLGNVAKVPATKTLQMEQSALRQIFSWANRNGIVQNVPEIRAPKTSKPGTISRRPAFELHEWRQLYQYLRKWAMADEQSSPANSNSILFVTKRTHSLHRWQRQMLRCYVLFMGTSGLRPNEARQLRWRDQIIFFSNCRF
jgi:integrase